MAANIDYKALDNNTDNATILKEAGDQLITSLHATVAELVGSADIGVTMNEDLDEVVAYWIGQIEKDEAEQDWFLKYYSKENDFDRNDLSMNDYWSLLMDIVAREEDILSKGLSADEFQAAMNEIALPARRGGRGISLRRFMDLNEGAYRSFCVHVNATNLFKARAAGRKDLASLTRKTLVLAAWAYQTERYILAEQELNQAEQVQQQAVAYAG